jgi:parvulin-like peptidyl-prolyl isomerase
LPKKNINQTPREMTKRQLSHWQRENRRQRIILLSGIILIVAILAVVGTGVFMNQYQPYHATILKVGDKEYDMDYYINMLAYYGKQYGPEAVSYFAASVPDGIAQNQIYIEQAAKNPINITVSDADVQKYLTDNNLSKDPSRADTARALLTIQKMQSDYFPKQVVGTDIEHRNVQAMFLASQSQVDAVKARLDKGENFSDIAAELSLEKTSKDNKGNFGWIPDVKKSFNPESIQGYDTPPYGVLSTILNQGNGNTSISDDTLENQIFASNTTANSLTSVEDINQMKDLGFWLVKVTETRTVNVTPTPTPTGTPAATPSETPTPTTVEEAHVYTMLLGSEQQANDIKAKLEQGGEGNDWATLAKANSLETDASSNGGDQGFVSKGKLPAAVEKVVFPDDTSKALTANTISSPLADTTQSTAGGFWLVQVNGIENQKISDANRTILAQNLSSNWLAKVWKDNQGEITKLLTPAQEQFAIQQAQKQ